MTTRRLESRRKGDKATQRKRDLTHCKAGDDNRLTSALSSSGSSSSLETQLIFVIMPHPHLPRHSPLAHPRCSIPPSFPLSFSLSFYFSATSGGCFLLAPSLPSSSCRRTRFNEISCHRDILLPFFSFLLPPFPTFFSSFSFVFLATKKNPGFRCLERGSSRHRTVLDGC